MRIHEDEDDTITGTGLGLATAKELSTLLGGNIGVESMLGIGSRFYFNINASHVRDYSYVKAKHVLIVDNSSVNRMLYNNMFAELGMITHSMSTITKALQYIKTHDVNLAFIGVHPDMNESELIKKLKKIPVISISADSNFVDSSFDKNITAPIDTSSLHDICTELLFKKTIITNQIKYIPQDTEKISWFRYVYETTH